MNARAERVAVTVDRIAQQPGQRGGFFVGKFKVHSPDMGARLAGAKAGAQLPPLPAATFPCKRGANPKRSGDGRRSPTPRGSARRGGAEQSTTFYEVPVSYL